MKSTARLATLQLVLLGACVMHSSTSSILGVATIGARSRTMNVVRLGRELVECGHSFTMLISEHDVIGAQTVNARTFPGLNTVSFKGPEGVGTEAWASSFTRDPQKVQRHV